MTKIEVLQLASMNDEQSLYSKESMLYSEISSTETEKLSARHALKFPEPKLDITHTLTEKSGIQVPSGKETSMSAALHQAAAPERNSVVSQRWTSGSRRRRCGGLSEY